MKQNPLLPGTSRVILAAGVAALLLPGCSSLQVNNAIMVKVPSTEIVQHPRPSSSGWKFQHVLEAPKDEERRGQWYVAWNEKKPLRTGMLLPYWQNLFHRTPEIADATFEALHAYPVLLEPNKTFGNVAAKAEPEPKPGVPFTSEWGSGVRVEMNKMPLKVWPDAMRREKGQFVLDPVWHKRTKYTQLDDASKRFTKPGEGIRVGHLDNGLDGKHAAAPLNLVRNQRYANAVGLFNHLKNPEKYPEPLPPEKMGSSHGLGTVCGGYGSWIKIDAQKVPGGRVEAYEGWLGAAPYATVVPVRVAPSVFSISTGELAYGIDYASRQQHCDVITMSHGGSPTQAWVDAVNAAYERGTAMFAAESDYFSLSTDPFRPRGFILASSPVYPAGFRRVVGVAGVTAAETSYARNNWLRLLRKPSEFMRWFMRGSYGADGTSTTLLTPNHRPDPSQVRRQGQLRPHPISAYSPNVAWASVRTVNGERIADGLDMDGAGTSASTPQVSSAAALWLQKNRHEIPAEVWNGQKDGWKKAEAVYYALLKSADRHGKIGPDEYLGAGTLKADDALKISYHQALAARKPKNIPDLEDPPEGSLYCEKTGNDYFDGARSFWKLLGTNLSPAIPPEARAGLRQRPLPGENRTGALTRLYYNTMLLREWHGGDLPNRETHERMYWARAKRKAEKASPATAAPAAPATVALAAPASR